MTVLAARRVNAHGTLKGHFTQKPKSKCRFYYFTFISFRKQEVSMTGQKGPAYVLSGLT